MLKTTSSVHRFLGWLAIALLGTFLIPAEAQAQTYDPALYSAMEYRSIGPYRGGRAATATGIPGNPTTFYMGATGGGVWKTTNGGGSWENISDGFFGGSIGAVAVSAWDPNIIYVGGGEVTVRGNVSHGYGVWKSMDGGETWEDMGLNDSRRIPRIRIHPRNPDLVYVAALGHLFGPNDERGVYRSNDGGETWERILFVNNEVGAVDLEMDPNNPRVLYATMWRVKRTPYSLESGGEGSSFWKSTDGGDTWTDITHNPGLPQGMVGIMGVSVSPANSKRVYAIIEAEDGGVFSSNNGGDTWTRVSEDRNLRQRAWYYTRIHADPVNEDLIYVLNVQFWRSKDGGRTYSSISTPHGDHHDLWIDPTEPNRMVIADDGGAQVSYDAGDSWSTYYNQPTSQFYRVTTDNSFPYRIYGAQQDNSTVRIPHRTGGFGITEGDWEPTAGGESGHIAPHPDNPDIVYGGSYGGFLQRVNHATGEFRAVDIWPDNPMGWGAAELKYRFQWNFPIFFSPHDSGTLYAAGNVLFKTHDEGQSWTAISPDLTRDDKSRMQSSGGPITKDNTSVEYYGTIFAALESPHEAGVLWAGSDDGLLHVSRDGGQNWDNVTPSNMPEWTMINSIEAHPTSPGGLYVAATGYKQDDFRPYLYKTTDYGRSWTTITRGIDPTHFTRVIRADPDRPGLLYAGTETGMYVSFDDGANWESFQQNLPIVPITDLALKNKDLIVATQGRSFWVMDDLTPFHQLNDQIAGSEMHFFTPRETYLWSGGGRFGGSSQSIGQNPPRGAVFRYYVKEDPAKDAMVKMDILEDNGTLIKSFSSKAQRRNERMAAKAGMNTFVWNLRYPDASSFPGMIMWAGGITGPVAPPGMYRARLTIGDETMEVPFELRRDPRISATDADLHAQFDFLRDISAKLTETHDAIGQIREVRKQLNDITGRVKAQENMQDVREAAKAINEKMTAVEEALYQTKNRSRQDPLNYPIRLNNKLAGVAGKASMGQNRPTTQMTEVRNMLTREIDAQLNQFQQVMQNELPAFNEMVRSKNIPAVMVKPPVTEVIGGN